MIGTPHRMALPIILLIKAEQKNHTCFEYAVYEVLNTYMALCKWPDEKKASLYSRLAEKVVPTNSLIVNEQIVSDCLWQTEQEFYG